MADFEYTHTLNAASIEQVFAVYCNPEFLAALDERSRVEKREWLERIDDASQYRRRCVVDPKPREVPAFMKPFVPEKLTYDEEVHWDKSSNIINITVKPRVLSGKTTINAQYSLKQIAPGKVQRTYRGKVSVDIRLVGGKIEKSVAAQIGEAQDAAAALTQEWLDRAARG